MRGGLFVGLFVLVLRRRLVLPLDGEARIDLPGHLLESEPAVGRGGQVQPARALRRGHALLEPELEVFQRHRGKEKRKGERGPTVTKDQKWPKLSLLGYVSILTYNRKRAVTLDRSSCQYVRL